MDGLEDDGRANHATAFKSTFFDTKYPNRKTQLEFPSATTDIVSTVGQG